MNIQYWNVSRVDGPAFGTAKYENILAEKLSNSTGVSVRQTKRKPSGIRGTMPLSWLFGYRLRDADIVHATFQTIAPAGFVHRPKNFVVTVHDLAPIVYPEEVRDLSLRLQWYLTPRSLTLADKIIAISHFTKQEILRLTDLPESKIRVVHQGIDHDRYQPRPMIEAREKLGLDTEATYVLVVSSSLEHKRIEDAKPVLDHVREQYPDAKLLKAGYGESLSGEHIVNTGWIPEEEMPLLYNAADVYFHPSEYEGFGLPVLEAMACGTPVVAREVASIPEIVGDSFEMVEPDAGPKEIANAVSSQLSLKSLDQEAIERSKQFSWEKTAVETKDVYDEIDLSS